MLASKRRLCVAPVPPLRVEFDRACAAADEMAGRDGGTGALIEPRNIHTGRIRQFPACGLMAA
jgi:hypothetical protein